jgi:hypothetical protein
MNKPITVIDDDLFPLGWICITDQALAEIDNDDIRRAMERHAKGDWGEVEDVDIHENNFAIDKYLRIFSVYKDKKGKRFWIITEADRSATTVLLPSEY